MKNHRVSVILMLLILINTCFLTAQTAVDLNPNSNVLPRLTTTEQNTISAQKAGNVIYNVEEKKIALHDGTSWNYLSGYAAPTGFKRMVIYDYSSSWIVPSGVTTIQVEIWGGGDAGNIFTSVSSIVNCRGGRGSHYALFELNVVPNETLNIVVGYGGAGGNSGYGSAPSTVKRSATTIASAGSNYTYYSELPGLIKLVPGEMGQVADFSFQQVDAGVFRKIVRTGAGGGTYPFFNNGGRSSTLEFAVPSGTYVGGSLATPTYSSGSVGGGGACAYEVTTNGGIGRVIIYY